MRIPESTIDDIRQRADIAEIARDFMELKQAGDSTFKACCPFHHEKTPSFHINAIKQVYHCFGCGVGGNVIDLVKGLVNTDFVGALRWLGRKYNIDIPEEYDTHSGDSAEAARKRRFRDDGMRLLDDAAGWFQSQLNSPAGAEARSYLESRGIDRDTILKYRIGLAPESWDALALWARSKGYSNELLTATGLCLSREGQPNRVYDRFRNRIMFTICDELSRPVAFSGRLYAANQPQNAGGKYVNSPESDFFHKGRILYGFNFARSAFKDAGWALVCEGQLDVIACHRSGLGQAIAAQGTAFTEEHARMLRKANVTNVHLAFDGDPAGLKAAARTIKLLHAESIQVMVTPLPGGTDPDSIFRSGGPSALGKIMDHAVGAVDFTFAKARAAHPENTPEAKSAIVSEMMDVIASIQDSVARTGHCQILAKELSLPENVIFDLLASIQQKNLDNARRTRDFQRPASEMPVNVRGGAAAPPPSGGGMPVFHAPAPQGSPVAETLLDLALCSRQVAVELTTCDLLEYLPTSPVAQALTMLLASTSEDEWEYGLTRLTSGEFISDSAVSRIITAPQFASSSPEILEQAKNDCLRRLELVRLDREYAGIQDAIKNDPNDFSLLLRAREIIRLRMELQKRK